MVQKIKNKKEEFPSSQKEVELSQLLISPLMIRTIVFLIILLALIGALTLLGGIFGLVGFK